MPDAQRRKELRQRFKSLFKLGKEGAKVKGSSFDTTYIKSLSKNDKGLEQIRKIYSEVTTPLTKKMMNYLQGKSLEEALGFGIKSQNELVETLENYIKTKTDESRDIFLTAGLGFSPEQVDKFEFSFTEEKPKQPEAVAIPEAQREIMKEVEKAKIKMVDKVQEKGEKKLTVEEMKKITESLVDTALDNAVKFIEKTEKKLNEEQKQIMRDQLQMEIEDKISKSSQEAKTNLDQRLKNVEDKFNKKREELREKKSREKAKTNLDQRLKNVEDKFNKQREELREKKSREKAKTNLDQRLKNVEDKFNKQREELRKTQSKPKEEEVTTAKEDIAEEKEAQARAKEMRSQPKMTEEEVDEILGTSTEQEQEQETPQETSNENVKMEMKKPNMKTEIDDLQPLPSKSDFIPPMRLGTRGKDIKDLLEDIAYFMKNFKSQLKRESEIFKEVDKTNIEQLRKLHNKIVGKLAPKEKKEEGKKVGIVVNADEYIREQMKKILQEQTFSSLRPQDVVIDVGSRASEGRDTKDFGDFAVKRTIDGGLASTREAVFRYMPSENDQDVGEEGKTEKQRKKPNRISMPKSRLNNERTTAMRMNVRNPFRVPQKTMKLKYLY